MISYCPSCQTGYGSTSARVLGEKDDSYLLHIRCGNCRNAIIALVMVSSLGVSSVGLVTDLHYDEVDRFKDSKTVTTDDVIEVHHLLQDQDRLFARL